MVPRRWLSSSRCLGFYIRIERKWEIAHYCGKYQQLSADLNLFSHWKTKSSDYNLNKFKYCAEKRENFHLRDWSWFSHQSSGVCTFLEIFFWFGEQTTRLSLASVRVKICMPDGFYHWFTALKQSPTVGVYYINKVRICRIQSRLCVVNGKPRCSRIQSFLKLQMVDYKLVQTFVFIANLVQLRFSNFNCSTCCW